MALKQQGWCNRRPLYIMHWVDRKKQVLLVPFASFKNSEMREGCRFSLHIRGQNWCRAAVSRCFIHGGVWLVGTKT